MSHFGSKEWLLEVAMGKVPGHSLVNKFGRSDAVGTTFAPVALGNIYNTLQPAAATTLRIKAGGHANDTAAGSGAREVTFEGLDSSGNLLTEAVATNGALASTATTGTFIRLFRAYVSASGTYATSAVASHSGTIVIENGGGGTDWATIANTSFGRAQSQIGIYTVPAGKTGYLLEAVATTDTTKTTNLLLFFRTGVTQAAPPYDAMRLQTEFSVKSGRERLPLRGALKYIGPCDIGFMAKVDSGAAEVDIDFELLLVDD